MLTIYQFITFVVCVKFYPTSTCNIDAKLDLNDAIDGQQIYQLCSVI